MVRFIQLLYIPFTVKLGINRILVTSNNNMPI